MPPSVYEGRMITDSDIESKSKVIIMPKAMAKIGDIVSICGNDLEVVGLTDEKTLFIPINFIEYNAEFSEILGCGMETGGIRYIFKKSLTPEQIDLLKTKLMSNKENFIFIYTNKITSQDKMLFIIASVLICGLVAIFAIINIISLIEYLCYKNIFTTKIYKICGASNKTVFLLLLFELFICVLIALVISICVSPLLNMFLQSFVIKADIRMVYILFSCMIFIISSLIPVTSLIKRISKASPIENI